MLSHIINPDPPTSTWTEGTHHQKVEFTLPVQTDPKSTKPIKAPPIVSGPHYLTVSVHDTSHTGRFAWTLLDNPEAVDFFYVGRMYTIQPVYVTAVPVEITRLNVEKSEVMQKSTIRIGFRNVGATKKNITCVVDVKSVIN